MFGFLIKRLISVLFVALVIGIVVFVLIHLVPGDPAAALAGQNASPARLEALRTQLGLNQPLHIQFVKWFGGVLQGDFGTSIYMRTPVVAAMAERLEPTASLALFTIFIATAIGVPLGIVAARRQNSVVDRIAMTVATLGLSIPTFWLGLLMILLFAVQFGWLPSSGYVSFRTSVWAWLGSLIMPAFALGFNQAGIIARMTRSSLLEVMREDYVRTAHSKGLPRSTVYNRHALRNALLPIVTVVGLSMATLAGGVVVIETVFNIPGAGRLVIDSVLRRDYPVIQGSVIVVAVIYAGINLAVDLSYALFDPRIRYG